MKMKQTPPKTKASSARSPAIANQKPTPVKNKIKDKKTRGKTLAIGVRYDGLAKRIGYKREMPGTSLSILINF